MRFTGSCLYCQRHTTSLLVVLYGGLPGAQCHTMSKVTSSWQSAATEGWTKSMRQGAPSRARDQFSCGMWGNWTPISQSKFIWYKNTYWSPRRLDVCGHFGTIKEMNLTMYGMLYDITYMYICNLGQFMLYKLWSN